MKRTVFCDVVHCEPFWVPQWSVRTAHETEIEFVDIYNTSTWYDLRVTVLTRPIAVSRQIYIYGFTVSVLEYDYCKRHDSFILQNQIAF